MAGILRKNKIIIGTRSSELAQWQANKVKSELEKLNPDFTYELKLITTTGDNIKDTPLYDFKEIGIFAKELDIALLEGDIDMAVHSLKDIETTERPEIHIGAYIERDEICDCVVVKSSLRNQFSTLGALPKNSIVGTSSVRRSSFLGIKHPSLVIKNIRGNINTRIRKLEEGDYSAIILAAAGLERLGYNHLISQKLNPEEFPPAVSQGAIGVTCLEENSFMKDMLKGLNHYETKIACIAERALLRTIEGGCKVPLGVFSCFYLCANNVFV